MASQRVIRRRDPTKVAVGLRYDSRSGQAPALSIKGSYFKAEEIIKLARRFGIPVIEQPTLADSLKALDLDHEIPESLYESVALLYCELERMYGSGSRNR